MSSVRPPFFRLLFVAGIASLMASCSSTKVRPEGEITRINPFWLDYTQPKRYQGDDPSIGFERAYRMYGAVGAVDTANRQGMYYTLHWRVQDVNQPVILRMEYRQNKTGLALHTQEQRLVPNKKKNVSSFNIIGNEYTAGGRVTSFRFSLLRGKQVLDQKRSYLWDDKDLAPKAPAPAVPEGPALDKIPPTAPAGKPAGQ